MAWKKPKMLDSLIEHNWCDLQPDLLELIGSKLSFVDIPRFRLVCCSWYAAAKSFLPWPLLMLPEDEGDEGKPNLGFMSVDDEEKMEYMPKNYVQKLVEDGRCVGSSHGWLVVLDQYADPFLLNPFSGREIPLPRRETFPNIDWILEVDNGLLSVKYKCPFNEIQSKSVKDLQQTLVVKAVLSANPSSYDKNFKVVIIYGFRSMLGFCEPVDSNWRVLSDFKDYSDVIWHDNKLYALRQQQGVKVEVWDLSSDSLPTMNMSISPAWPGEFGATVLGNYSTQWYIVASMGDIFFVVRYIGEFVNGHGDLLWEEDLLTDEDSHPKVYPYRTVQWETYKLDLTGEKLLEVKSLNDRVLFLGGNHSLSLSTQDYRGLRKNSIYFTDDYWERMYEDYLYGGHDIGRFSLQDGTIDLLRDLERMEPTPFWIFPDTR